MITQDTKDLAYDKGRADYFQNENYVFKNIIIEENKNNGEKEYYLEQKFTYESIKHLYSYAKNKNQYNILRNAYSQGYRHEKYLNELFDNEFRKCVKTIKDENFNLNRFIAHIELSGLVGEFNQEWTGVFEELNKNPVHRTIEDPKTGEMINALDYSIPRYKPLTINRFLSFGYNFYINRKGLGIKTLRPIIQSIQSYMTEEQKQEWGIIPKRLKNESEWINKQITTMINTAENLTKNGGKYFSHADIKNFQEIITYLDEFKKQVDILTNVL